MPTIVEHKETRHYYLLVGAGYGAYQSAGRTGTGIKRVKIYEQGAHRQICVCDRNGTLGWVGSDEVTVINVDGINIKDLTDLSEFPDVIT